MKKIRKLIENFQHISDYMGRRQIATIAASTAFWFFLSIVPIVILCVSVLPYTSITEEQLLTTVAPVLPDSMNQLIRVIIADVYSSGVGVLSISIAATVWSSAMGFASLIRGLEDIYEQPRRAGFLMRRARGIIYTLGMLLMMILSFVLGGFGQQIKALVEKYLPGSQSFFSFLLHFRFVVVIALLTIFFAAIFRWSTGLRPRFGEVLPGALTALEELSEVATLAIVSNGAAAVQEPRIAASGIDRYMDGIYISETIGAAKPSAKLFEHALRDLGITNRSRVLMVGDDLLADIKGGINAGVDTCWYNPRNVENKTDIAPKFTVGSYEELYRIVMEPEELENLGVRNRRHSNEALL